METLDNQAVQMAQAIRQIESGGDFTAKGKSGEYGAYQFTPDTWNADAPKYGVNTPIDQASPEEQNKVAYGRIKSMKDSGYNVGQVASVWNSGDPNAYIGTFSTTTKTHKAGDPSIGTNSYGANYNVPDYTNKVANTYQTIKGGQEINDTVAGKPRATSTSSSTPNFDKWLGIGSGVLGVGALIATGVLSGGAAVPAEVAGVEGLADLGIEAGAAEGVAEGATGTGILSKAGNLLKGLIKSPLKTIGGLAIGEEAIKDVGAVKGLLSGTSATPADTTMGTSNQDMQNIQSKLSEIEATMPQSEQHYNNIQNAFSTALGSTITGNKMLTANPEVANTAALYGLIPAMGNNGTMNSIPALSQSQALRKESAEARVGALEAEGEKASMSEAQQEAFNEIKGNKLLTPNEKDEAMGYIKKEIESYGKGQISLGKMEHAKVQQQHAVSGKAWHELSSARQEGHKALQRGLRNTVKKHTKSKELYEKSLKEEAKLHQVEKALRHLHGKKIPANKKGLLHQITHSYGKYIGLAIGNKIGGIPGAIIGTMIGDNLAKRVDKRFGKTIFETPAMRKMFAQLKDKKPAAYHRMLQEFKRFGIKMEEEKEHKRIIEQKRKEYKEKKAEPKEKSEYEPYQKELPTIKIGKKPKKVDKIRTIT